MAIGEQIKTLRKKIGYTQKQLAEKCGMAEITIRQYELNKREPRQETIEKIATALGVDPFSHNSFEMASDALEKRMNLKENMLLDNYRQLNTSGQQKADNYVEDLTKIPEYQKEE